MNAPKRIGSYARKQDPKKTQENLARFAAMLEGTASSVKRTAQPIAVAAVNAPGELHADVKDRWTKGLNKYLPGVIPNYEKYIGEPMRQSEAYYDTAAQDAYNAGNTSQGVINNIMSAIPAAVGMLTDPTDPLNVVSAVPAVAPLKTLARGYGKMLPPVLKDAGVGISDAVKWAATGERPPIRGTFGFNEKLARDLNLDFRDRGDGYALPTDFFAKVIRDPGNLPRYSAMYDDFILNKTSDDILSTDLYTAQGKWNNPSYDNPHGMWEPGKAYTKDATMANINAKMSVADDISNQSRALNKVSDALRERRQPSVSDLQTAFGDSWEMTLEMDPFTLMNEVDLMKSYLPDAKDLKEAAKPGTGQGDFQHGLGMNAATTDDYPLSMAKLIRKRGGSPVLYKLGTQMPVENLAMPKKLAISSPGPMLDDIKHLPVYKDLKEVSAFPDRLPVREAQKMYAQEYANMSFSDLANYFADRGLLGVVHDPEVMTLMAPQRGGVVVKSVDENP